MSPVAAVILAAGTSSRFRAAAPDVVTKLVAEWQGVPLVRHVALAALASRASPILVVTGHAAPEVRAALAGLDLAFVDNPDFGSGLATSLQAGLAALPAQASGALILLGDMPHIEAKTLDRLSLAFEQAHDIDAIVPVHAGRRGNPAVLGRALFAAAARLEGDEGARRLLRQARVLEIDVDEAGVAVDVDDPATLRNLPPKSG